MLVRTLARCCRSVLQSAACRSQAKGRPECGAHRPLTRIGRSITSTRPRRFVSITAAMQHQHSNRLAKEESPYLLQHQHNPVDWYPWGQEAFDKARKENKPIFLSVGYSTCHWCHVMERESFESEEIGLMLNADFVAIKVDREERPDIDKVYMTYIQATQGGGGWPMNVFLTPGLEPFVGGTYWPPTDMYGRPGFSTVLRRVAKAWSEQQESVLSMSADVMRQLREFTEPQEAGGPLSDTAAAQAIEDCARQLAGRYDAENGGFGGAPKFPRPAEINALLCSHSRASAGSATVEGRKMLDMALHTLSKMAAGGMHDALGGGFHRYSVDEFWHVPHFEKMMYDNPQLVMCYLSAFLLSEDQQGSQAEPAKLGGTSDAPRRDARHARTARDILDYMRRDMTHPEGGLFSAEDADSESPTGEKKEGAFYIWSEAEIDEVLGPDRAPLFKKHYFVKSGGNTTLSPQSDPHNEFTGLNCLIERQPLEATAQGSGLSLADAEAQLAGSRRKLHQWRAQRPRPHLDDKVVAAWNGMAIGAYAAASRVLTSEVPAVGQLFPVDGCAPALYLEAAIKAADFVRSKLYDPATKKLGRSFRIGPSAAQGFADDYAYMVFGLLHLYEASGDTQWLQWAVELQETMDALFWDPVGGGYYSVPEGDASILLRQKEDYDGAEPAPSSIAAANLFRLAALSSGDKCKKYQEKGRETTAAFGTRLTDVPLAMPEMCCSLFLQAAGHMRQVVIAGTIGADDTEQLLNAASSVFAPDRVVVTIDLGDAGLVEFWRAFNPEMLAMVEAGGMKLGGRATAFVCQNFTCQAPTSDPAKLREVLGQSRTLGSASLGVPTQINISKLAARASRPSEGTPTDISSKEK